MLFRRIAGLARLLPICLIATCNSDQHPLDPSRSIRSLNSGDITPPTVAITAPLTGTTLTNPVTVTADATDDTELAGVQFLLNGTSLGDEDLAAPYETLLNTDTLPAGAFELTASARDTAGNSAVSEIVSITIFHPDTTPPTVAITAPAPGSAISAPATVTADASDDWQLAGVTFQFNGVDLAPEDTEAPFETGLLPDTLPAGPFDLIAIARDTAGNIATSAAVSITILHPDDTPPTVAITAPADGATLTTPATVTADASDENQVGGVEFFLDGISLGAEDQAAPYEAALNTDTLPAGTVVLTAVARDTSGNTTTSAAVTVTIFHPDVTPPTVAITAPTDGATLTAPTTVIADAADDFSLAGVEFFLGGVSLGAEDQAAPYEATVYTDTLPPGAAVLTAVARDTAGNTTTSAAVTVTIIPPDVTPPIVTITSPSDGATVSALIAVTASATDNLKMDGVQFQLNGSNLGAIDPSVPYSVSLNTYTLPDGPITLTAVARDTAGNMATSPAVTVTVANPTPLNVVVIISDDQRYDHMQYMPLTSALLNPQSVVFTKGFATTPLCCPSRTSIFTGLYSHNTGVYTNVAPNGGASVFSGTSTLATWVRDRGWRTGLIGKYLNEYFRISPTVPPGWDDFQAIVDNTGTFGSYNYLLNENGTLRTYGTGAQNYATTVLLQKAQNFILNTPERQPLMLFFTPYNPHAPANPHPSDIGRFASQPNWRPPSWNEAVVTDKPTFVKNLPRFTTAQITSSDALHRSMLESLQSLDRAVVDLVGTLQQTGRWQNTLLFFISDNGLSWGEHRLLDRKQCPYDECIRIPFIVRAPGGTARTDTSLVANIDIPSTIAGFAGFNPPYTLKGRNLLDLINNPSMMWRSELLFEQLGNANAKSFQGVRTHRYMYNEYLNGERELYDLRTDPYQNTNVVTKASNATLVAGLKAKLNALKGS